MRTKLLLAGDVMTGRGIDQVMPHPCPPQLIEPGINKLGPGDVALASAVTNIRSRRRQGDIVVVSLHWGANWVGPVSALHRRIAHQLIEAGAADLVHGHSAHHPLPAEVHRGKLVLYGCGDLIAASLSIPDSSPPPASIGTSHGREIPPPDPWVDHPMDRPRRRS